MSVPDIADDLQQTRYTHPKAQVRIADKLTDFRLESSSFGTLWPYLYVESLNLKAAPEVDSAELVYKLGYKVNLGTDQFSPETAIPSLLKGKAIWIRIPFTNPPYEHVDWYGVIDTITTVGVTIGELKVQAVSPLQFATKEKIHSAYSVDSTGANIIQTGIGRPFNSDGADFFGVYGNRSANKEVTPSDHYVFSYEDRGRQKWTTHTAVQYLLARHAPKNLNGQPTPVWEMHPDTLATPLGDWYDTHVSTDGKSLKELLDELIPRKRGLSYYVYYDHDVQKIYLKMFTFVDQRIEISNEFATPRYLEANPNQKQVTLQDSIWFTDDCSIVESTDAQYDAVVAYGEPCTSTCTLGFNVPVSAQPVNPTPSFIADWSTDDEAAYKAAKSTTDKTANDRFRGEDRYSHVYRRFRLNDLWDGYTTLYKENTPDEEIYIADPTLDANGNPKQWSITNYYGIPMRVRGLKLLKHLPLKDRIDYDGNNLSSLAVLAQIEQAIQSGDNDSEYLAPMFFWLDTATSKYTLLDNISTVTAQDPDASKRRAWSVSVQFSNNEPSVQLKVGTGYQTMIARSDFVGAMGVYGTNWDPVAKNGINWRDIRCTVCIQFEHRLTIRQQITVPPDTRPERILQIEAKDARLDYLVPKTIVSLNNGTPVYTDGGYVRDDRERVKAVVKATAEWYGREKRALSFAYKQVKKLVEIGDLITSVDGVGFAQGINTPVTGISYTVGNGTTGGTTKIETGFAEVDFT